MRFWQAFARALLHTLATLAVTLFTWSLWMGWVVFIRRGQDWEGGGVWDTFRFAMHISLIVTLLLCGGFLVMSLVHHLRSKRILKQSYVLSSLSLSLFSLVLWLALPQGGAPLILLLVGLPVAATVWMFGSARSGQIA